jgi:predicted PurR-regulated permease PerM
MAEETTPKDLATGPTLPDRGIVAGAPGPATAEALKRGPEAVRRSFPMALSIALGILLASLLSWVFKTIIWFILLLYLSFVAASILEAPVQWLKRIGIRRGMAAVIVMVGGLAITAGIATLIGNTVYGQVASLSANLEKSPERINDFVNHFKQHFPAIGKRLGDFDVAAEVAKAMPTMSSLWANAMSGVETISWLVIMFFVVLYMLVDGADHLKALRCVLPKQSRLETTRVFHEIARAHRGWALASLSNVASSTLMTGMGLWLLGIPGSFVLGLFAGLGELIPNIGPVVGAMPAIVLTLVAQPDMFFYVVGMFIAAQTIQSYTISPLMLKFSVELPVLVTIVSVLVFGLLFGFVGILVAIPLVADMVVLWQYANRYLEKDAEDYDAVNEAPLGARKPMSPDNTAPWRLQRMFRPSRRRPSAQVDASAERGRGGAGDEAVGMDKLEQVERQAALPSRDRVMGR